MPTRQPSPRTLARCLSISLLVTLSGTVAAVAQTSDGRTETNTGTSAASTTSTSTSASRHVAPKLVEKYRLDVEYLANPFMEGRGPGTRGNRIAAEYIEDTFRKLGLGAPFENQSVEPPKEQVLRANDQYMQSFIAGRRAELRSSDFSDPSIEVSKPTRFYSTSYSVLGISTAESKVTAPLAFVGYSIEKGGQDGKYSSYPADQDKPLDGKIAVMFRFEPMNAEGKSLWRKSSDGAWSGASGISDKIKAAVKRGAAGIILVSPPGCDDPRASKLESTESSSRWMHPLDIPVFMMSPDAADRLVRAHDPNGRSLMAFRTLADSTGGVIDLGDKPVTMSAKIDRSPRTTWNVAGILPGAGALADEYVVVGAHYDHVGYGYTGGSRTDEYGIVHPGADDNASGTAGLLLAAQMLKERFEASSHTTPTAGRRSILFIAFSAEEMGLIGSREFVRKGPLDAKQTYAMLNMDMIGRLRENKLEVAGTGTAEGLEDLVKPEVEAFGFTPSYSPGGRGPSDHASFYAASVPVLHVFTGLHEQYHTPRDTVDTINFEGGARAAALVADLTAKLATREGELKFTSTDRKRRSADEQADRPTDDAQRQGSGPGLGGVKVRFGIAPGNYAEGEAGVSVGEVYPGTSADEAGIKTGDRLMRWNGQEIGDVADWMGMLGKHKPGDVVDVVVKRGTEDLTVKVTLKSRDQAPR